MEYTQYWQIDADIDKLFNDEKYDQCIELLNQALSQFPDNFFDIVWYKAVIYSELQDYQECLNSIDVLIEKGFACPMHWGRFDPLREDATFHKLDKKNRYLLAQAQGKAKMEYKVYLPEGYTQNREYPLFIVLHGDGGGGNIKEFRHRWKPDIMLKRDSIVA